MKRDGSLHTARPLTSSHAKAAGRKRGSGAQILFRKKMGKTLALDSLMTNMNITKYKDFFSTNFKQ